MISQSVLQCLDTHSRKFPQLQGSIELVTGTYKEKLWHQLTDALLNYTNERIFDEGQDLIDLYNVLIKDLTVRVNPLKYALITISVSRQFTDLEQSIEFLDAAKNRLNGKQDAVFLCQIGKAEKKLQLGLHHDCFEILNEVKKSLEQLSDVDPKVYAHLSKTFALYYRRKEDHENFYKSSLQYLAYTPASELSHEEKRDWSIKMGMSVLLGKNIYNIAELLDKEILQSLNGTDFEWLNELLQNLGRGLITEFSNAVNKHHEYITRFSAINKELQNLQMKVKIINFLELLFACDKDDRSLKFDRIAQSCQIQVNEVEFLIMKAMSLELVKGQIDEVDQVVHIDWILPRYLSRSHIEIMVNKIQLWEQKMEEVIKQVEGQSEELLGH
ncbi:26s proteasome non-atpase regulatory subunit 13-like [Stylonychia lemnae]|uniref:26s proteasome non-atpase regulatory subunit 13-like n=1 Tax=Stylonychia lemnae TaxID=5949 RepID=A0A078AYE5_STYLE|nr:26s proteasome non-atpase regulatory subunit 13-like [Stylonychia lemnae]|eukprot:CDW85813.1 26s proteasome non-atpase regulatory subunit 13-like [Stylonychia lemnae]